MRFSRGLLKIQVQQLYLYLLIMSTTFLISLHIVQYHRLQGKYVCKALPTYPMKIQRPPSTSRARHDRDVCFGEPKLTKWADCPQCYRATVHNLTKELHRVPRNITLFPRGPPAFFHPKKTKQQDLIYNVLIAPESVCSKTCPYLVAVVPSVIDDQAQRIAIRSTWGSVAKTHLWPFAHVNADVELIFVLGHQNKYTEAPESSLAQDMKLAQDEAALYRDILFLDMQDSYYNLTLKVMSSLHWVRIHCPGAKFVLKIDVDTFVNIPLLLDLLLFNEERLEMSVLGYAYVQNSAFRTGKWMISPEVWPPPFYPVYASGTSFVLSSSLLGSLAEAYEYIPANWTYSSLPVYLRDCYITGVLADALSVETHTLPGFLPDKPHWPRCAMIHDRILMGQTDFFKTWRAFYRFYGGCWKIYTE
ncbi:beta-1,3-galactosyltransferase 5-like isoform X2 [Physella acuta]|uniref:beta-1,3-galactosyltransferase 5-like isoform X2 n=1 Tax=Physella acuta TaxID=109671 RepID=UPI0027DC3AA1|nr:beta-1,3-galactosyltransferase 5-like isoform X2 [Physella acuta]